MKSPLQKARRTPSPHPCVSRYFHEQTSFDMPPELLEAYKSDALRTVVRRAYEGSSFYRAKMDGASARPDDIRGPSDLGKLPLLTKDELRGDPWRLLTCPKRDIALVQVSTGTTGGEEIYMAYTRNDYLFNDLAPKYSSLFPIAPGDICLNALPYEMSTAGLAFHKTFMDGYGATVIAAGKGGAYSTPEKTVKVIKDLRPNVVVTSPSWAVVVGEAAADAGLDLSQLGWKKMWLTGEGCSPSFRSRVEQMWGSVANFFYGSLECGVLGMECDAHSGYHLPEAHVIMEVIDPTTLEPLSAGETGELVITALLRYDSPLLRFRTGDMGVIDKAPCPCGSSLTRFHLRGRAQDHVKIGGKILAPIALEEALLRMPEVGNWFQFIMPRSGSIGSRIKIRCEPVRGTEPSPSLAETIANRMQSVIGVPFDVELARELPRPSGKVARVIQE